MQRGHASGPAFLDVSNTNAPRRAFFFASSCTHGSTRDRRLLAEGTAVRAPNQAVAWIGERRAPVTHRLCGASQNWTFARRPREHNFNAHDDMPSAPGDIPLPIANL
jgi:hypothetical protein